MNPKVHVVIAEDQRVNVAYGNDEAWEILAENVENDVEAQYDVACYVVVDEDAREDDIFMYDREDGEEHDIDVAEIVRYVRRRIRKHIEDTVWAP